MDQGEISAAIEGYRSVVALDRDPRKPASLSPMLWNIWGSLTINQSRAGQADAARRSLAGAAAAAKEAAAFEDPTSGRAALFNLYGDALQARVDLDLGKGQAAFDQSTQVAARIRSLQLAKNTTGGNLPSNVAAVRANFLRNTLATVTLSALRTGRYGEAEAAARERHALPPNPFSEQDPQDERSRAQVTLAHALAMQQRVDEARAITDSELPRYRTELKAGARGLTFAKDYSYALYVDALVRPQADPRRTSNLTEASRQLDALGDEANRLVDIRELRRWIDAARTG
jgi:hypothetical protein